MTFSRRSNWKISTADSFGRRSHFNLVKMTVHELSRDDARRIAVRAQALDRARPGGLLEVVRRLTLLQIDPVAAVAPNADLVAWSRLGSSYSPGELDTALQSRSLIELRAMIRPAEDLALYRADMARWDGASPG